MLKRSLRVLR